MALVLAAACGGGAPEPEAPAEPAPAGTEAPVAEPAGETPSEEPVAETPPAEPKSWSELDREGQIAFMKEKVVPHMGKVFGEWEEELADLSCMNCHGQGAKEGKFDMPSPDLPKLKGYEKDVKEHPKATKFMAERVVPEMAKLLDMKPYDPETKEGFGCAGCHMYVK